MDSATLQHMILQNSYLAVAFAGIWSADNFSKQPVTTQMPTNFPAIDKLVWFQIVNTSPEKSHGSHWLLLGATIEQGQKQLQVFVWDCLGQPVSLYTTFFNRLNQLYGKTGFRQISLTLQNASSYMCGLYCLFLIHYIAKIPHEMSQLHEKFKLYSEIEIICFMNDKYNTLFRYTIF